MLLRTLLYFFIPIVFIVAVAVLAPALMTVAAIALVGHVAWWLARYGASYAAARPARRVAGVGENLDTISEAVDMSGPPLRPFSLRRAWRDARLVPKRLHERFTLGGKRRKLMPAGEARRLFGATLRTRRRDQHDLAADPARLKQLGLPVWETEVELAAALDLSLGQLHHYASHRVREARPHYLVHRVPKRAGGSRLIMAPKRRLKAIQRRLLELLVARLPVSQHAHGFREGRSIRTAAEPHVGRAVVARFDLADFFPSLTFPRVRGYLVAMGYSHPVATTLAVLMTEAERQPVEADGAVWHVPVGARHAPQGAPTSPGLANALTMKLDHRLAGLARKLGFTYTRYADDLSFSSDDVSRLKQLTSLVRRICREEGFALNDAKTRVARAAGRQQVCGVTVNRDLGLSRRERRQLRAGLHRQSQAAGAGQPIAAGVIERLRGRLAYLHMLNPAQARPLQKRYGSLLHGP